MGLTNEEHLIFVRLEKILDSMSVTIKEIRDKLEVLTDKLSPKTVNPILVNYDDGYIGILKKFLFTRSMWTREDKCKSGAYILHDLEVSDQVTFSMYTVIDPGKYVLFVGEKMLYICGDDSGIHTYMTAEPDAGVAMILAALKSGKMSINGFTLPKEAINE